MTASEKIFKSILSDLSMHPEVAEGKMMSSSGIQYKGKNFAFLWGDKMVFKLGRDFDPSSEGIHKYELLNPFKNKPPLKDWFVIAETSSDKWVLLAEIAYQKMSKSL
ncbi:hypothetical protein [Roseivirga sp. E12]|uniref:hypothetical protein n=1 Tax=Roseivirga sp. E12 TaxID=2819237 RepID=UPI001ABC72DD|nr:hypothetical protein [Roseivirga sp. E12]MBO3698591.1 hypothetical protein [Roseivirga sp. E12]